MSLQTVKAIIEKDLKSCPECGSCAVEADENDFPVNALSTSLMICYDCGKFHIAYPDTVYLIEKMIDVEIPEATILAARDSLQDYQIGKSLYELLYTQEILK